MKDDRFFLEQAIEIGKQGTPPHLYGAAVVLNGELLALERNHVWERSDPSAHAEVSAIVAACQKVGNHNIPGAVLYGSHEPCLMCFSCAAWAKFERLVFAYPASEATHDMYEFTGVNIYEMAQKLSHPMKVEMVRVKS